jgi:tripartite-type tricarboxylate transporter receptor subunit TctC
MHSLLKIILCFSFLWGQHQGFAQSAYPNKPIHLIVPFEAGGTSDTTARSMAIRLEKALNTTIVVENRMGANGAIGAQVVKNAPPDGYTVLHTTPAFLINTVANKNIGYDVFKDFTPISLMGTGTGYVMVINPALKANTLNEFIAYAKDQKNGVNYSSPGVGNALHLASEIFAQHVGIKTLHIPFKGTPGALTAVVSGEVDFMIMPPTIAHSYVNSGKVKAVAFTGQNRSPDFPNVPTFKESGYNDLAIAGTWLGWFAPANTPKEIRTKIQSTMRQILQEPDMKALLQKDGFEVDGRSPDALEVFLKSEHKRLTEVLKTVKLN